VSKILELSYVKADVLSHFSGKQGLPDYTDHECVSALGQAATPERDHVRRRHSRLQQQSERGKMSNID